METRDKSESVIAKVSGQLAAIEKRDWELWLIVTLSGIVAGVGLLALAFPAAFMSSKKLRMDIPDCWILRGSVAATAPRQVNAEQP